MDQLKCSLCKQNYDLESKIPRLFPCCGHSFCSLCINSLITACDTKLTCPEDGKLEEFFNKEKGIESFPLNFALKSIIEKHSAEKTQVSTTSLETPQEKPQPSEPVKEPVPTQPQTPKPPAKNLICEEHNKNCELVCLTDQAIICSDCVLFGKHKIHQFYKMVDFKKMVKQKLLELENTLDQTRKMGTNVFASEQQLMEFLGEKVDRAKQLQMGKLNEAFENVKKNLHEQSLDFDKMIANHFQKFYQGIELASQNSDQLRKRQIKINSDVAEIKAQIKNNYPNFAFILQNVYSDKNLMILQKQLKEELGQHNKNVDKMIVQQINKLTLDIDLKEILSKIQDIQIVKRESQVPPPQPPVSVSPVGNPEDNRETRIQNETFDLKIEEHSESGSNILNSLKSSSNSEQEIFDESEDSSQRLLYEDVSENSNLSSSPNKDVKKKNFIKESDMKKNQSFLRTQKKMEDLKQTYNANFGKGSHQGQ